MPFFLSLSLTLSVSLVLAPSSLPPPASLPLLPSPAMQTQASVATCRAQGDPHYTTFDGRRYDMMGTCLYSMAELCGNDETLPAFSVEAKNEHRGSRLVSYVGLATVRAYSHAVSLARGEVGFARVRIQSTHQGFIPTSRPPGRTGRPRLSVRPQIGATVWWSGGSREGGWL